MTSLESRISEPTGTVYRFGAFELDPGLYILRRDGSDLDIQPKVLDLLLYLVARRDRVVPKEEILEALWRGVSATDDVLSRAIHAARQAVGDDGEQQSVIQTLRRRGFRFVAAIESVTILLNPCFIRARFPNSLFLARIRTDGTRIFTDARRLRL